jgi:hypothetical protein
MAIENAARAIELFGEHDPGQQMRPGRSTEREGGVGAFEDRPVESLGAAKDEGERAAGFGPSSELIGEGVARMDASVLIEGHEEGGVGDRGEERASFTALDLDRAADTVGKFGEDERRTVPESVSLEQVALGARGAADGDDANGGYRVTMPA